MTDITVIRGLGDRQADDIEEPLLADDQAAIARGRTEIDASTQASEITLSCRYRADIASGDLVQVVDQDQGAPYRAQVTGISYSISGPGGPITQTLSLWRPST